MPKQAEYLGYITTSTNALLAIINNILDLATIDAGAMSLNLGPIDIRKTIDAAAEGIQDRLATDRIELKVDTDPDIGSFVGDERRVVQVLYNLLANASDSRRMIRTVSISARRTDHSVVFSVTDSGPGIPAEVKTRCSTGSRAIPTARGIAAPALACRWYAPLSELHGGKVRVDSIVGKARPSRATSRSTRAVASQRRGMIEPVTFSLALSNETATAHLMPISRC